jgi:tryptophanyl-tRNA synthetase
MSKSDASDFSRINLTDGPDQIADKIRKAKTDPNLLPDSAEGLAGRPEAENLLGIYAALTDKTMEQAVAAFAGQQFSAFKAALADAAVAVMGPIGKEMKRLMGDPSYVDGVLRRGAERASAIAVPNLRAVQDMVGLLRP